MKNLVPNKTDCIISHARTIEIQLKIQLKKNSKKCKEELPKHEACFLQYITQEK